MNIRGFFMASKNEKIESVIGEGSVFEGRFDVKGSLQIDGRFEGDIKIEDQLIVGETGKVKTNVIARRVIIAGTFIGNIKATEEVILLETGKVMGDIKTPTITFYKGVITYGNIEITSNKYEEGNIQRLIEESFNDGRNISPVDLDKKGIPQKI